MNELMEKIINSIKEYAKGKDIPECDALSIVIGNLINISAMSFMVSKKAKDKE